MGTDNLRNAFSSRLPVIGGGSKELAARAGFLLWPRDGVKNRELVAAGSSGASGRDLDGCTYVEEHPGFGLGNRLALGAAHEATLAVNGSRGGAGPLTVAEDARAAVRKYVTIRGLST